MKTKQITITGVKQAISNYKKVDNFRTFGIFYIDKSTGELWCNLYNNCNTWTEYHDKNIVSFKPYVYIMTNDYDCFRHAPKLTMQLLREAAEKFLKYEC